MVVTLLLLAGLCRAEQPQSHAPEDSIRVAHPATANDGELKINPKAVGQIDFSNTVGDLAPRPSTEKSWLKPNMTITIPTPHIRKGMPSINLGEWKLPKLIAPAIRRGVGISYGTDLMAIFTKEFWDKKGRERRKRTMEALSTYGDSTTVKINHPIFKQFSP
ncbi:MAG: DUF4858 domain-containing protein [Mediterranea sp.]|jgi:hypothetical protein|nr:DUF4858 domain-containing protein [Mediterranea sp.]